MSDHDEILAAVAQPVPPGSHFQLRGLRWTHENPPPWRPGRPDWQAGAETFRLQAMAAVARGGDPYAVIRDLKLVAPTGRPSDPLAGEAP